MKRNYIDLLLAFVIVLATAGCAVVGGIFKGGFIIGLIVAIIVIGLLVKMFGGRGA
jgi:hypothetical protein